MRLDRRDPASQLGEFMRLAFLFTSVATTAVVASVGSSALAELVGTYDVGSGSEMSNLQFDFTNGDSYLYLVRYDGSHTGRDLFDIVKSAQPGTFDFATATFPFGEALFGVSIGANGDSGFGTPPEYLDYWHYWVKTDDNAAWDFSSVGFADRVVANGSWDGWVFGSNGPPAAVPAPAAAAIVALAVSRVRRRRG